VADERYASDAAQGDAAVKCAVMETIKADMSQADIAAVESAWGGAKTNAKVDEAVEQSKYSEAMEAGADRYSVNATVTEESASAGAGGEESDTGAAQDKAAEATATADRYVAGAAVPVMLPAMPERNVTRGQAPTELETNEAFAPPEPQALEEPPATAESSRRAREAFGDALAEVPSAGDRYGAAGAASEPAPVAAVPRQSAPRSPAAANPFDSGGAAASAPAAIEPAPQRVPVEADTQYDPQAIRSANSDYRAAAEPSASRLDGGASGLSGGNDSYGGAEGVEGTGKPGERALEGLQNSALVIQKFAPPEIQVGKAAKFAVQVRNTGSQTAEGVVVRDEVPAGTRVVNTTPKASTEGNHLVWELGDLSTGEERTVEIELMPMKEGEIGSVATVSCVAQASAKTRCTMPQLAVRMTAPSQVLVGQEQRVKIELRNPGTGDATGVMLLENVPDNVKHAAGPALEFEIGTLRAGETRELELILTAERAGRVINALTARADGNLQVQQEVEFEVIAPDLQLSVDGPSRRYLERPATYQVIVENPGTAPAHDIEIVSKLPKGMQFVKANNMGEYDAATHSVYWSLAQLPEGEKGSVELVAMPIEAGQQTLQVQGKAQQGLTDEAEQEVLVEGMAAIMFEVRDAEDPIEVGGETTYEIRVMNQGTKAATNVQVVVNLPTGIEAISASGESPHTVRADGILFEPLAQLAPKTDSVFRIQVKGVQPGDQRTVVQVRTDDMKDIRREESTQVFGDE
jgi:uncharacterized repeat protein (TIGR01451 family)